MAMVHVIEFQKRGLPHCHILVVLDQNRKLRDGHDVDSIICAEIPDERAVPDLYRMGKSFYDTDHTVFLNHSQYAWLMTSAAKCFRRVLTKRHFYQVMATRNTGDVTMGVQYSTNSKCSIGQQASTNNINSGAYAEGVRGGSDEPPLGAR